MIQEYLLSMISNKMTPVNGYNEFSPALCQHLSGSLAEIAKTANSGQQPLVAAFDADGTLWDTDIGEAFFDYQIHHCDLKGLPTDPWKYYLDTKKNDHIKAYVWLAQISEGHSLTQVRQWAKEAVMKRAHFPAFTSQKKLITELRGLGIEIYVVTASVKWAVEPAAELLGIDQNHVLGITTKVVNGIISSEPVLPITWRAGKAEALLAATGGVRPVFCAGNTYGDIALLESSSHLRLAVSTQIEANSLFEEERRLKEVAFQNGWLMHGFR